MGYVDALDSLTRESGNRKSQVEQATSMRVPRKCSVWRARHLGPVVPEYSTLFFVLSIDICYLVTQKDMVDL
jgi:hypothetical protein